MCLFPRSYRAIAMLISVLLLSCKEDVDMSARYVSKEHTIISYMQAHPDSYSEYVDLLYKVPVSPVSETSLGQLLSARGNYTVFAPTNEAIDKYLEELFETGLIAAPSWDAFPDSARLDSIRQVIVFNSIIDGGDQNDPIMVVDFPASSGDEFVLGTINDKKLSVKYGRGIDSIYININCPVNGKNRDIWTLNGIIHQMERVIAPQDITAADYLHDIIALKKEGFLVIARAIEACGLMDTLGAIRDETYEQLYKQRKIEDLQQMTSYGFAEGTTAYVPRHRLYGFTIFAETDDFWRSQGLDPVADDLLEQLQQWILDNHQYSVEDRFTTDQHFSSPENLLNQWTTYHILPMRLPVSKLVIHRNEYGYSSSNPMYYTTPVYEYYTTLGKRRLLKLYESKASAGVYLNRFPIIDNTRTGTGMELGCDADKVGCLVEKESEQAVLNDLVNACIYPIDAPLSYSDAVRNNLAQQRIRFDGMSLFPEAINNDFRCKASRADCDMWVYIPNTNIYPYIENMIINDECKFVYFNSYQCPYPNLQIDEMKAVGRWELTFKLPPVPRRGTYELRYDVLANKKRGIAQCYFGSDPGHLYVTGIPLDLTMLPRDGTIGWEADSEDQDYNSEVDKRMRNLGFMKGVRSIVVPNTSQTERDRSFENVRRILIRTTMDPNETYYLRLKSVLDSEMKEFYMDYLELCPKEVYDNPEVQEDIW